MEVFVKVAVKGIVIKEASLCSGDKSITILTDEYGIITAFIRHRHSLKKNKIFMIRTFAYCSFLLFSGKSGYTVDDIEIIDLFWNIKNDIRFLAISQYFCEICLALLPEKECSKDFLRLLLNSIFYISSKKKEIKFIKAIFEMRACSLCGYIPNLICCQKCGVYESEIMYFSLNNANILCVKCAKHDKNNTNEKKLKKGELAALRHIVYSDFKKLFSFDLSVDALKTISDLSEKYIKYYVKSDFKTLEIYKEIE